MVILIHPNADYAGKNVLLRWHNAVEGPLLEWGKDLVRDTQIRQKIVRSGAQKNRFW